MRKLLIIGVTGLVGSQTARLAEKNGYQVYGTYNARPLNLPEAMKLDTTDRNATTDLVAKIRPDVIVDTAALNNIDYCEAHHEETDNVNVRGTRTLAEAASSVGSRIIFLSTDLVFDGESAPYSETDMPNPLGYYARSKLEAESVVSGSSNYAISRPSMIYGWNSLEASNIPSSSGKAVNFGLYCVEKFKKGESVQAVNDQLHSPTLADNLAEALLKLADFRGNGIFHTAGRSCLTTYDFALKVAGTFGFSTELVQPVATRDLRQLALGPRNSCLSVENTEKELGMRFLTADEGLQLMKTQFETESADPR